MATDGLERRSPRHLRASDPAGRPAERGGATPPPEDEAVVLWRRALTATLESRECLVGLTDGILKSGRDDRLGRRVVALRQLLRQPLHDLVERQLAQGGDGWLDPYAVSLSRLVAITPLLDDLAVAAGQELGNRLDPKVRGAVQSWADAIAARLAFLAEAYDRARAHRSARPPLSGPSDLQVSAPDLDDLVDAATRHAGEPELLRAALRLGLTYLTLAGRVDHALDAIRSSSTGRHLSGSRPAPGAAPPLADIRSIESAPAL